MGIADITSSRAKLIRAYEHFHALDEAIKEFGRQTDAKAGEITYGRDGAWHIVYLSPVPLMPVYTALVVGDCLNNIRAALDHLVWQLVLREDQEPQQTNCFPVYKTVKDFSDKCETPAYRGKKSHALHGIPPNGPAWAIIKRAQPFNSPQPEDHELALLAQLSNIDKHRAVLVQRAFVTPDVFTSYIRWRSALQPIEQRISTLPLSAKQPAEIIRFRFADGVETDLESSMDVDGALPVTPYVGDAYTQVSIGLLGVAIERVGKILDEIAALPRVQETALHSALVPEYIAK